jgi:hypothetical protein
MEDKNFAACLQHHIFRHLRTCTNWAANSEFPPYLTRCNWLLIHSSSIPNTFSQYFTFRKLQCPVQIDQKSPGAHPASWFNWYQGPFPLLKRRAGLRKFDALLLKFHPYEVKPQLPWNPAMGRPRLTTEPNRREEEKSKWGKKIYFSYHNLNFTWHKNSQEVKKKCIAQPRNPYHVWYEPR